MVRYAIVFDPTFAGMQYHILNGDALAEKFPVKEISGQTIIMGEAFIEGPLSKELNDNFWDERVRFVASAYEAERADYDMKFLSKLLLMDGIASTDEVCLWFEDDLFCQTNMWFIIYYLSQKTRPALQRVFPDRDEIEWSGFGKTNKLVEHYTERTEFTIDDIELGRQLWEAYADNDREKLKALSHSETNCFRFLPEVIQAHLDREPIGGMPGRPQRKLLEIIQGGATDFYDIFDQFVRTEAIYGFGDLQVMNMLKDLGVDVSEDG